MIKPITFEEANLAFVIAPPDLEHIEAGDGKDGRLPVFKSDSEIISCWELEDEDIEKLIDSRRVWIRIIGQSQPIICVSADYPFVGNDVFPETIDTEEKAPDAMPDDRN